MSVQELMSLIDKNSTSIPEGDYLKMCTIMKHLHGPKDTLCVTPDFSEQEIVIDRNCIDKCYQWIMTMCYYDNVSNHYKNISKRTEVTPALKVDALVEIATAHGVTLEDYTISELRAKVFEIENEKEIYEKFLAREVLEAERSERELTGAIQKAHTAYREFSECMGYQDLSWLIHWGSLAKRSFRSILSNHT
jgi:hypothetical protein